MRSVELRQSDQMSFTSTFNAYWTKALGGFGINVTRLVAISRPSGERVPLSPQTRNGKPKRLKMCPTQPEKNKPKRTRSAPLLPYAGPAALMVSLFTKPHHVVDKWRNKCRAAVGMSRSVSAVIKETINHCMYSLQARLVMCMRAAYLNGSTL